jgi:hypothetical protein
MTNGGLKMSGTDKLKHEGGAIDCCLIQCFCIRVKESILGEEILGKSLQVQILVVFISGQKINHDGDSGGAKVATPFQETLIGLQYEQTKQGESGNQRALTTPKTDP